MCGGELGSGRETREGTLNREGEASHDKHAGSCCGRQCKGRCMIDGRSGCSAHGSGQSRNRSNTPGKTCVASVEFARHIFMCKLETCNGAERKSLVAVFVEKREGREAQVRKVQWRGRFRRLRWEKAQHRCTTAWNVPGPSGGWGDAFNNKLWKWSGRHNGRHDLQCVVGTIGKIFVWRRKCSGRKLLNSCQPAQRQREEKRNVETNPTTERRASPSGELKDRTSASPGGSFKG